MSGQREEALETAREAVAIRRQLAQASPAAYLPDLAMSLNNLGNRLSDAGPAGGGAGDGPRGRQPLPAARPGQPRRLPPRPGHVAEQPRQPPQRRRAGGRRRWSGREAVSHYRQLAEASPAAYLPDLAMSLNNLGQLPQRGGPAGGGAGDGPRGRHHPPAARRGQPRRLPPRPGHVAEQPRQLP